MLAMVSYHRPKSGHITCYLNRTYHVLLTRRDVWLAGWFWAVLPSQRELWRMARDARCLAAAHDSGDFCGRALRCAQFLGAKQGGSRWRCGEFEQPGAGTLQEGESGRSDCTFPAGAGLKSELSGGFEQSGA